MPRFCTACGAQIGETTSFCPSCGKAQPVGGGVGAAPAPQANTSGLTDNVAGMLAYITFIPAIIFLAMEPYNRSRFVRFHSFQCIFAWIAAFVLSVAISAVAAIPVLGLVMIPVSLVFSFGCIGLWILLLIKANQGQMFKLPVIGDMAEKQANAM